MIFHRIRVSDLRERCPQSVEMSIGFTDRGYSEWFCVSRGALIEPLAVSAVLVVDCVRHCVDEQKSSTCDAGITDVLTVLEPTPVWTAN